MPDPADPVHDPPLEPRDEAVFLLTAAAEVEHALMVQYLYAAYSVRVVDGDPQQSELAAVRDLLLQVAREEMGHLATVQNLLLLVGGSLHLGRGDSSQADGVHPFRFALEPVSSASLAKYVIAESPAKPPAEMTTQDLAQLEAIRQEAEAANGGMPVRHVGQIFARLAHLLSDPVAGVLDTDFALDAAGRQATFADWGLEARSPDTGEALVVESFTGSDLAAVRAAAVAAVHRVGAQGEGFDLEPAGPGSESHFERFLDLYRRVSALDAAGVVVARPLAVNPTTAQEGTEPGRIVAPRARAWAALFDLRYRLLLGQLGHFLLVDQPCYSSANSPERGDRTARGLLLAGTFDEMRRLAKIAGHLVLLPQQDPETATRAGPPFGLPYTLNLPDRDRLRWRSHLDVSRAAGRLIRDELLDPAAPDGFLEDVLAADGRAQTIMTALAAGQAVPPGSLPAGFAKVTTILEEAVRGFTIVSPIHGNFWAGRSRDEVVDGPPRTVRRNADGSTDTDPDRSPLVQRLEHANPTMRMPRFRPPVPPERVEYIREWIRAGAPDDVPPDPDGLQRERDPRTEGSAPPPGPLSFEIDIKGLFRASPDRSAMMFRFDLHRYEDVRDHASEIESRLLDGSMPCDTPWPPERIAVFSRWITDGLRP
ncbi:ferritin-like domain-containing protein [Actinomycetospora rhizophila]|uniref:Ferritin-like domain-containing protein n=1 Tax=Actinomycetospora rhizophila TaxID=1416876 RepID=A0ABV9ZNT2_9PSEU